MLDTFFSGKASMFGAKNFYLHIILIREAELVWLTSLKKLSFATAI